MKRFRGTEQTSRSVEYEMLIKRQKGKQIVVKIIQKIVNQHYGKFKN